MHSKRFCNDTKYLSNLLQNYTQSKIILPKSCEEVFSTVIIKDYLLPCIIVGDEWAIEPSHREF